MQTWARMARTACSECGRQPLAWTTAVHLLLVLDDLDDRKRVAEIVNLYGRDAEAWRCEHCGAWGVFGSPVVVAPPRRERRAQRRRGRRGPFAS